MKLEMKDRSVSNPASELKNQKTLPSPEEPDIQIGGLESSERDESDYLSSSLRNTKHLQKLVQEY